MKLISDQEGEILLNLAKKVLANPSAQIQTSSNQQTALGLFVSLKNGDQLRGCVGTPYLEKSLEAGVQELTNMAATADSRFSPIKPEEILGLVIEISLLTSPKPIEPNAIDLGRHGLLIRQNDNAALYLPKVPIEKKWSVQTFLEELCLKANLPRNIWKVVSIHSFETQIFTHSPYAQRVEDKRIP